MHVGDQVTCETAEEAMQEERIQPYEERLPFKQDMWVWWNNTDLIGKRVWGKVIVPRTKECWCAFLIGSTYVYRWCPVSEMSQMSRASFQQK